jgi:hypothetical protein
MLMLKRRTGVRLHRAQASAALQPPSVGRVSMTPAPHGVVCVAGFTTLAVHFRAPITVRHRTRGALMRGVIFPRDVMSNRPLHAALARQR